MQSNSVQPLLGVFMAGLALAIVFIISGFSQRAFAIDNAQRNVFQNGIGFYNLKDCVESAQQASNTGGGTATGNENAQKAFNFFVSKGFTTQQAAGIVGNLMQESQVDPKSVQRGGPGRGIAQWSVGERWATLQKWAAGRDILDLQTQLDFMVYEMTTTEKATIPAVKATNTPGDAAYAFQKAYERAGKPNDANRTRYANDAFAKYAASAPPVGSAGDITAGAVATTNQAIASGGALGQACQNQAAAAGPGGNFPLKTTRSAIDRQNAGMFANGTTGKGGHPYTAYDILADPGTPIIAFANGTVTTVTEDRCPGRMISVYDQQNNRTISYLHMDFNGHAGNGAAVTAGQEIGKVGPASAGCGVAHLHIDASQGNKRPGCSRLDCPAANASQFIDIGPQLFEAYQKLAP